MKRFYANGGMSAAAGWVFALCATSAMAQPVGVAAPQLVPAVVSQAIAPASAPATSSAPQVTSTVSTMSLTELVRAYSIEAPLTEELNCLATAVYFEAKGEPLEGQLAVAEVVQNRARSGRYPTSLCAVVKQKAQFSFVRAGQFPRIDANCPYWKKAQAVARISLGKVATTDLSRDVLWYHADYVAPSWGRRLSRVEKIGAHIFYRA